MRIVYIGTGGIGLPALTWLLGSGHEIAAVFTQPDKPGGRRMELLPSPIKQLAMDRGIPVFQPVKIRAPEAVAHVRSFAPDLIIVMAYGQILPKGLLEAPRLACINLHASILPRHRGAAPIQAAILAGDKETGVTVMVMDEGLDTGDILLIRRLPIHRHETGGALHDRLAAATPAALAEALALSRPAPLRASRRMAPSPPTRKSSGGKMAKSGGIVLARRSPARYAPSIHGPGPSPSCRTARESRES